MKVLLLTPYPERLMPALKIDDVIVSVDPPGNWPDADWVVSFGYRHKIDEPELSRFKNRILNIHIGYLPWNRGSDPNFWSWFDDTPKGVTIHLIDDWLDTGPILFQRRISHDGNLTLATSYDRLQQTAAYLFAITWPSIRQGTCVATPQPAGGTYHRSADKDPYWAALPLKYDTPVSDIAMLGREARRLLAHG